MASKITALTALTGANTADNDLVDVVDVSDTTMAASGTNKKLSVLDLAAAIGLNGRLLLSGSTPSAPASGTVALFEQAIATKVYPAYIGPSGQSSALSPHYGRINIAWAMPNGNGTTVSNCRLGVSSTGTATASNCATTNLHQSMRRIDYLVTTASTTAVAGWRGSSATWWRGNAAGLGGFLCVQRFGLATGVTTSTKRAFVGMGPSNVPTDVNPSTLTNVLGVGFDSTDTNWQIMHNDAAGTCVKSDTGIAKPASDRQFVYEISIFCKPNDTVVYFQFTKLDDGTTYSYTSPTTDLPSNTTFICPWAYSSVGGTSSVTGIALMGVYVESDY